LTIREAVLTGFGPEGADVLADDDEDALDKDGINWAGVEEAGETKGEDGFISM